MTTIHGCCKAISLDRGFSLIELLIALALLGVLLVLDLEIVGESYRQAALERLSDSGAEKTQDAIMIPEANNPHDRHAVRVAVDGLHVAYLSRDTAKEYRGYMGAGRCAIPVHLVKGGPEGTIGVFTGVKH
jgi:prepilin-type N-terminal cleavage/methylation domain-containing protein